MLSIAPRRDWFIEGGKNLENLDRVYGSTDKQSTKVTKDVLSIVCKKLHVASSYRVSEMVKSVENAYRHMDITLANQLSLAFPKDNIREVTLFPMNQNAQDLMMQAPSEIDGDQLKELSIKKDIKKN